MVKIGIIREGKSPQDTRVHLSPSQCKHLLKEYSGQIDIIVQGSPIRCYTDEEYRNEGIKIVEDVSSADVLLGVKEVPIEQLIPNKSYFFFSHTIKMQEYNRNLMQALIKNNIRMIDYELLTYADGKRVIGFGYFAGVVGAHNGILTYGKKTGLFDLKPAHKVSNLEILTKEYRKLTLPNIKIVLTGSGRVAAGFLRIMEELEIKNVEPEDFLRLKFDYPVYTHLKGEKLYTRKDYPHYDRKDFYENPEKYKNLFPNYISETDVLLHGIYWEERIEPMFKKEDIQKESFNIQVIADVTCDINGSIPINIAASSIDKPVYGIAKKDFSKQDPFQNTMDIIDVMAVDNLPNELPRDASEHFGESMIRFIIPELLKEESEILNRATICENGKLTKKYEYLHDYAYEV